MQSYRRSERTSVCCLRLLFVCAAYCVVIASAPASRDSKREATALHVVDKDNVKQVTVQGEAETTLEDDVQENGSNTKSANNGKENSDNSKLDVRTKSKNDSALIDDSPDVLQESTKESKESDEAEKKDDTPIVVSADDLKENPAFDVAELFPTEEAPVKEDCKDPKKCHTHIIKDEVKIVNEEDTSDDTDSTDKDDDKDDKDEKDADRLVHFDVSKTPDSKEAEAEAEAETKGPGTDKDGANDTDKKGEDDTGTGKSSDKTEAADDKSADSESTETE